MYFDRAQPVPTPDNVRSAQFHILDLGPDGKPSDETKYFLSIPGDPHYVMRRGDMGDDLKTKVDALTDGKKACTRSPGTDQALSLREQVTIRLGEALEEGMIGPDAAQRIESKVATSFTPQQMEEVIAANQILYGDLDRWQRAKSTRSHAEEYALDTSRVDEEKKRLGNVPQDGIRTSAELADFFAEVDALERAVIDAERRAFIRGVLTQVKGAEEPQSNQTLDTLTDRAWAAVSEALIRLPKEMALVSDEYAVDGKTERLQQSFLGARPTEFDKCRVQLTEAVKAVARLRDNQATLEAAAVETARAALGLLVREKEIDEPTRQKLILDPVSTLYTEAKRLLTAFVQKLQPNAIQMRVAQKTESTYFSDLLSYVPRYFNEVAGERSLQARVGALKEEVKIDAAEAAYVSDPAKFEDRKKRLGNLEQHIERLKQLNDRGISETVANIRALPSAEERIQGSKISQQRLEYVDSVVSALETCGRMEPKHKQKFEDIIRQIRDCHTVHAMWQKAHDADEAENLIFKPKEEVNPYVFEL